MYGINVELPEQLLASDRSHNKIARQVLQDELQFHHTDTMREHFKPSASAKYGYAPRNEKYNEYKRRRWGAAVDLFKSGRSRAKILGEAKILVSGSAAEQSLRGRLVMRLPFTGGTGARMDDAAFARMAQAVSRGVDSKGRPLGARQLQQMRAKLATMGGQRGRSGITADQLVKELEAVTAEEVQAATRRMGAAYVERIKRDMKRPRLLPGAKL